MDLKDFKEFIRNKRRNEFLKLKQTKKYQDAQQGYDLMYKDVNDEVMNGLQESVRRKAKVAADVFKRMSEEDEGKTEVAKAEVANRAVTISADALGKKLLLLRRKKLTKESASSQYNCDGAVYEPYKTAREEKTGKFAEVKRRKR